MATKDKEFYVGIDVGGTFTDGVVIDQQGTTYVFKTPTVSDNPSQGFITCLRRAAEFFDLPLDGFIQHTVKLTYGTTVVTNALLEGRTAKTGFIISKGFKDTLLMARIGREYLGVDLQCERPRPLVPRNLTMEVTERVDRTGAVVTPLSIEEAEASVDRLLEHGVRAIGVGLLWSHKAPLHEQLVRDVVMRKDPNIYCCLSSEVAPITGEYERFATTAINASLGPVTHEFADLAKRLYDDGLTVPLLLMQSTGGVIPAEDAGIKPICLVNSGPVGGLMAAKAVSEFLAMGNVISIDMGGTSFDVGVLTNGEYSASLVSRVRDNNVFVPMVDIHSVGAGGGSIAWLDMGRRLRVGPQSAGADPGPACYGKGGQHPTVTDADVVLGRINPDYFLAGMMPLDKAKAQYAIAQSIAEPLGMDIIEAAFGISQIVDAKMADAIRTVTIEKGKDPREHVMIAFGGAGPVHASAIAKQLGVKTIVIPSQAAAQSALGIVSADILHSLSLGILTRLDDLAAINRNYERLERQGHELLKQEGIVDEDIEIRRYADMRYRMQVHEVTVPVPPKQLGQDDLVRLVTDFEERYESLYGKGSVFRKVGYEIAAFRVEAIGRTVKPKTIRRKDLSVNSAAALKGLRPVFFSGEFLATRVYAVDRLGPGSLIGGPSVVEYAGTTAIIHPDQIGRIDPFLNLILSER